MTPRLTRRAFTVAAACAPLAASCRTTRSKDDAPMPISLAQWSLHRTIRAGSLDPLDFPLHARREFGLDAVEYVNQFFADKARDDAWLGELDRRCADVGVTSLLIMVDGEGELAAPDEAQRMDAVRAHEKWIDAAARLGCHAIRVNAGGGVDREEASRHAADSLVRLADRASVADLSILVENHGGMSSDGAWLAGVMRRAGHPRVGTLPDFGNFRIGASAGGNDEWYDRYRGVEELMPYAQAVSAKSHDFDADGNEAHTDYRRMLRIVRDAGYRGHVGIEYEGSSMSEADGIRATLALLRRVDAELRGGAA